MPSAHLHATLALLAFLPSMTACAVEEIEIPFVVTVGDASGAGCLSGSVHALVVDLFVYEGPLERRGTTASACGRCAFDGEGATCRRVARSCLCGGPLRSVEDISSALQSVRLEGVEEGDQICVRVVGIAEAGFAGQLRDCSVEAACTEERDLASEASFCLLGQLGTVSRDAELIQVAEATCPALDELVLRCIDDDCACSVESVLACRPGAPNPGDCRLACVPSVQNGCWRGSPACSLKAQMWLSLEQCAGFTGA